MFKLPMLIKIYNKVEIVCGLKIEVETIELTQFKSLKDSIIMIKQERQVQILSWFKVPLE